MSSLKSTCFAVVKASLKRETPLRSVSMTIAAVILFALNTNSSAQLKSSNDDAVRDAARRACVIHQETALVDELVRNCEHLARGPAFQDTQNAAWHQCARSPGLFGTVNSEKRLKWLRANQAGKNKICLEAVEEAKRNRNDPNALIVYKPSSGSAPQSSATHSGGGLSGKRADSAKSRSLYSAIDMGYIDQAKELIKTGASKKELGDSLRLAAMRSNTELIDLLLQAGANINARDDIGNTALHMVCMTDSELVGVAEMLLKKRADINATDIYGQTPLMLAARIGHKATVAMLISRGADLNTRDKFGKSAIMQAREQQQNEIVSILTARGAN